MPGVLLAHKRVREIAVTVCCGNIVLRQSGSRMQYRELEGNHLGLHDNDSVP